ncbi:MAG: helix-turn-helix transcriptional regulator [Gordonibacter sp.]|uniref:helix-turn-helix transcriptional regulator n=1 Tax=Gordonibacter sp. TaxID=1968902 RepID=UPI00321FF298
MRKRDAGRARDAMGRDDEPATDSSASAVVCPPALVVVIIVGFGLFRGVNSNSYLSAFASVESPFLFVPDLFFNVVVALTVALCSAVVIVLTLRGRLKVLSMPLLPPVALLIVAKVLTLFGVFSELPSDLALIVPGVCFGMSSVMLSLAWIEVMAMQRPLVIVTQIALGMLLSMVTSTALSALESSTQLVVSSVLLVIMALCAVYVRRAFKKMVADALADAEEAGVAGCVPGDAGTLSAKPRRYRDAFLMLGDALIAYCVLEAVIGLLNSFMLAGSITFAGSGTVSVAGMLIGIVAFSAIVFAFQRVPQVSTAFRVLMPIIASLLVFLPFLDERFNLFFSTVLLGSYYFIALLITYVVAEVAHERRVSSYVLMGAAMGLSRILLAAALVGGYFIGSLPVDLFGEGQDIMRYLIIIVAVIYALSVATVLVSRDRRRKRRLRGLDDELAEGGEDAAGVGAGAGGVRADAAGERPSLDEALDERCSRLAERGGLTEREGEILGFLARGRTKAHIAGVLFVSENTVRSHVRNIYAKLDVHTRQELIDLLEQEGSR